MKAKKLLAKEKRKITNELLGVAGGGVRRQILMFLNDRFDYCYNLANLLEISPASVWEHLHVLERHGLIERAPTQSKAYQRRIFYTASMLGTFLLSKLNTEGLHEQKKT